MKLVIVSGYAQSGKSTLARSLRKEGYRVASSSDILSVETLKYFGIPVTPNNLSTLETKHEAKFQRLLECHTSTYILERSMWSTIREAKIFVAEHFLVPKYTRQFFADGCLEEVTKTEDNKPAFIFSTIETEQVMMLETAQKNSVADNIICVNLRRDSELQGVDTRSLFPSDMDFPVVSVNNIYDNPHDLLKHFLGVIEVTGE